MYYPHYLCYLRYPRYLCHVGYSHYACYSHYVLCGTRTKLTAVQIALLELLCIAFALPAPLRLLGNTCYRTVVLFASGSYSHYNHYRHPRYHTVLLALTPHTHTTHTHARACTHNPHATELRELLEMFVRKNSHQGTVCLYSRYQTLYREFCSKKRVSPEAPCSVSLFYIHALIERRFASSTIKSAASSISDMFRYTEDNPTRDPLTRRVLATVRAKATQAKCKKPVTLAQLRKMAARVKPVFDSIRDYCLLLLMFTGMLRESEAVALKQPQVWTEPITEGGPPALFVFVEMSKTDQHRVGHTIVIGGTAEPSLCIARWLNLLSKAKEGVPHLAQSKWLFCNAGNGQALSTKTPCHIIKAWLNAIGVEDVHAYGSHSCRRGGATAAAAAGVEERLIKRHGAWRSDAVHIYIDESPFQRLSVSTRMLAGPKPAVNKPSSS